MQAMNLKFKKISSYFIEESGWQKKANLKFFKFSINKNGGQNFFLVFLFGLFK